MNVTLTIIALAWSLVGPSAPACSTTITVISDDDLPVQFTSAKLREQETLREVWNGRADGKGSLSLDLPSRDPYVLDLFMPGFSITSTPMECESGESQTTIVLTEVVMPASNVRYAREPSDYVDRAVGVCATKLDDSTVELSDGTMMAADVGAVVVRWEQLATGKFCADASFHWDREQNVGSFRITNLWW